MKKYLILASLLLISLVCFADEYKVLFINNQSDIVVGKKKIKVGSIISDNDQITWKNENQAIKVQNTKTGAVRVLSAKQFGHNKSIKDYYLKLNHLSTRENSDFQGKQVFTLDELANELMTITLTDTVYIFAKLNMKEGDFLFISYTYQNDIVVKKIDYNNEFITINRSLFPPQDAEFLISIYGYSKATEIEVELINGVRIKTGNKGSLGRLCDTQ